MVSRSPHSKLKWVPVVSSICVGLIIVGFVGLKIVFSPNTSSPNVPDVGRLAIAAERGSEEAREQLLKMGPDAVPNLILTLRARDGVIKKTIWRIQKSISKQWRRFISQRIPPPNAVAFRQAAAYSLGLLGTNAAPAAPDLVDALADGEGAVRHNSSVALGKIGSPAVPELIKATKHENATVRAEAIGVLAKMREEAAPAIPTVIAALRDSDKAVQAAASHALASIGAPSIPELVAVIDSTNLVGRRFALRSLEQMTLPMGLRSLKTATPATIDRLTPLLAHPESEVRVAALRIINAIPSKARATEPEVEKLLSDPNESVRALARQALKRMGADPG